MHRIGARKFCRRQQRLNVEVALLSRRRADAHRFVGLPHMQGAGIGVAEDRNRAIAKRLRGTGDAAGDLAAVGDQDFRESDHGCGRGAAGEVIAAPTARPQEELTVISIR